MIANSDELHTFVKVIDCGSISAAAELLGNTPSAVSRTLARLEKKFETTLLNRTTRRMELTDEGRFFLEHSRQILRQMDALEERLAVRRMHPAGLLRVDAASPFMLHAIVPHVGDFRETYPHIQLELTSNDAIIDLLEHRTDIAIRIGALTDSTLHARSLGSSKIRIVASPAYLARQGTPANVAALARHSLIGFSQPASLNQWPLKHVREDRYHISPAITASSGETIRKLALAGQGIAALSHFMTHDDLAGGRLVQVLATATLDQRQPVNAVYYRNTQLAPRIQCFLDFFQSRLT